MWYLWPEEHYEHINIGFWVGFCFVLFCFVLFCFGCTGFLAVKQVSLVAAPGLSCPKTCGILVPQEGIELTSSALEDGFWTTGPWRKSLNIVFNDSPHVSREEALNARLRSWDQPGMGRRQAEERVGKGSPQGLLRCRNWRLRGSVGFS